MIFDFKPWVLDVNVDETKMFYESADYSLDSNVNKMLIDCLSDENKEHFDSLGVDLEKVEVTTKIIDVPEFNITLREFIVYYLIKGSFLCIPDYHKEIIDREELFDGEIPSSLKIIPTEDKLSERHQLGSDFVRIFKHPRLNYDDLMFQKWDCGYILGGSIIIEIISSDEATQA